MSPLAGALAIDAARTAGTVAVPPFTLWPEALVTACAPSAKVAFAPAALRIVPELSAMANTETPSVSLSADRTT